MNLGRRTTRDAEPIETPVEVEAGRAGKGRPTPKRSDARQNRRKAAPKTRKEAAAQMRERNRDQRKLARQALVTGDERNLPPRDAGPEKSFARDIVDSKRSAGQYMFLLIFVALALSLVKVSIVNLVSTIFALVAITVMAVDAQRKGRKAKVAVMTKFDLEPSDVRGVSSYAFMRAMLPRRFRRPPPKVELGATLDWAG